MDPTLNLSGCVHPKQISQWLQSEMSDEVNNTGLYSGRFLITCVEPIFPLVEEIPDICDDLPSLERLLYTVSMFHQEPCLYVYDDEAKAIMDSEHNRYQLFLRDNHHQSFISGKYF